jgi:Uma2 family endonuclease
VAPSHSLDLLTAEEFYQLPDPADDGRMELIEGLATAYPPGGARRGGVVGRMVSTVAAVADDDPDCVATAGAGYLIERDPDTVLCPSVALIRKSRLPDGVPGDFCVPVAPDLAIEVVPGPSGPDAEADRTLRYRRAGVARVWIVDIGRSSVLVLVEDEERPFGVGDTLGPDELGIEGAKFSLPVSEIFR